MKTITATLALTMLFLAGTASAEGWTHASPGAGQFEGSYDATDDAWGIDYTCGSSGSQIGFRASGLHIAAGESVISVDGEELISGNTTYNSKWDATSFTNQVDTEWGPALIEAHNALIMALARGSEAVWLTPSGNSFAINLTGSADIKNCAIE